jgi:hypothetical protein
MAADHPAVAIVLRALKEKSGCDWDVDVYGDGLTFCAGKIQKPMLLPMKYADLIADGDEAELREFVRHSWWLYVYETHGAEAAAKERQGV